MEGIDKRYESLLQALASLKEILTLIENYPLRDDAIFYAVFRDSLIQRFEYSFDTFWKFLKLYLEKTEKLTLDGHSPRNIFKTAEMSGVLLNLENYKILTKALSSRNLTSHSYNVQIADIITLNIPLYYQTMHTIATSIKL